MKIFGIGHNYTEHNQELKHQTPDEPVVFFKPDSSLLLNNKPFFLPAFSENVHYETELLVKINRIGRHIDEKFAHRYYDEIGLGIDFTARDIQEKLRKEGKPWAVCKGFDGAAAVGQFVNKREFESVQHIPFSLDKNGEEVQRGNSVEMIFSIDEIIAYLSRFFTLKIGDIIFTGTPMGVGKVEVGDRLTGFIETQKIFDFKVL